MIWFVISIILLLFSAAVTGVALSNNVKGAGIGLIPGLVGLLLLIPACLYSVDVGEVAVIRNMGGSLAGHSEDAGFHWKTPWQSVIKYDTRNNLINFYKDTDYKYDGGSAVGKQVTVNDRSGASADIDIQVNYSLDPSAAEYLYSEYGKQQTFTQNYISNDLRSRGPRTVRPVRHPDDAHQPRRVHEGGAGCAGGEVEEDRPDRRTGQRAGRALWRRAIVKKYNGGAGRRDRQAEGASTSSRSPRPRPRPRRSRRRARPTPTPCSTRA